MPSLAEIKAANAELNRRERRAGLEIINSKPTIIWFESTSRCNLKCITCPVKTYSDNPGQDMDREVFEKVRTEVFPTLQTVQLQGDGEPTLSSDFFTIFDAAVENELEVFMITNGTLLTPRHLELFANHHTYIQFSIDGASPEVYTAMRRGANYDKVMGNVDRLAELKRSTPNCRMRFGFMFVGTRDNIHELPDMLRKASDWGAEQLCVNDFNLSGIPVSLHHLALKNEPEKANRYFEESRKLAEELGVKLILPDDFNAAKEVDKFVRTSKKRYPQECYSPWNAAFIDAEGNVKPCCSYPDYMGNLKQHSFEAIWNNRNYQRIRRTINSNHPPYYCKRCTNWWGINKGNPENVMSQFTLYEKIYTFMQKTYPNTRKLKKLYRKVLR